MGGAGARRSALLGRSGAGRGGLKLLGGLLQGLSERAQLLRREAEDGALRRCAGDVASGGEVLDLNQTDLVRRRLADAPTDDGKHGVVGCHGRKSLRQLKVNQTL